jgi:hypothetical protein
MAKKKTDMNPFAPKTKEEKEFMEMIWRTLEEKWKKMKGQNSH